MGGSLSSLTVDDWKESCAAQVIQNCTTLAADGLVDRLGQSVQVNCTDINGTMPAYVWGISAPTCYQLCGPDKIVQGYGDIAEIVVTMSTWLFPFVALIAQLPFETKDGGHNFLSACMALGSPALVTYSLALTALNRAYVYTTFDRIRRAARHNLSHIRHNLKDVPFILAEVQHSPMHASQSQNWLSSLICLEENRDFWKSVKSDLLKTRRGFTYSFFSQALFAALAYLLSYIAAVHDALGSPGVGLHFATSIVWSWMFPVVFGYIYVGSQYRARSIDDALNKKAFREDRSGARPVLDFQRGLLGADEHVIVPSIPRGTYSPPTQGDAHDVFAQSSSDAQLNLSTASTPPPPTPTSLPAHQSALLFSSSERYLSVPGHTDGVGSFASSSPQSPDLSPLPSHSQPESPHQIYVYPPLSPTMEQPESQRLIDSDSPSRPPSRSVPSPTWFSLDVRGDEKEEGPIFNYARLRTWFQLVHHIQTGFVNALQVPSEATRADTAAHCGFSSKRDLQMYGALSNRASAYSSPRPMQENMFWASVLALVLQWGTSGAAIFTAYRTPLIGLGCRSGAFLLYAAVSTLCWALLVSASTFSHHVMAHHENAESDESIPDRIRRLTALAVIFRILGKILVIGNAGWLISFSIMEDMGFFQTCWCQTDALQYGLSAWTPVFKDAVDLRGVASGVWAGGFTIATCTFLAVGGFFFFSSKRN